MAPGDHGNFYEGHGEVLVVGSADVEVIDSTFIVSHEIWTLDEESNEQQHGVAEPRLYLSIHAYGYPDGLFGCHRFVSDPPEVVELSLGGSENRFRCFSVPGSDAELILRNVGEVTSQPKIWKAELVGTYSENDGTEQYEIRLQTFLGSPYVECDDPAAER